MGKLMSTIVVLFAISICACQNVKQEVEKQDSTKTTSNFSTTQKTIKKYSLLGAWVSVQEDTSDDSNPTFQIEKDSIFYIDDLKAALYKVSNDSITIYGDDYTLKGTYEISGKGSPSRT